jgi:hypothetical protein
MKKPCVVDGVPAGATKPVVGGLMDGLPTVWAMMVDEAWDDGTARERATLLVLMDGAMVKLWLNDRALGRSCWVSGESLELALNALEDGLFGGSVAWRMTGPAKARKK